MAQLKPRKKEQRSEVNLLNKSSNNFLSNTSILICSFIFVTMLKILLIPSYHSTDFEVHRNWIALTSSLRPCLWYFDQTSPWTLDYPPMFAWFQKLLSLFAGYFDANLLSIHSLNLANDKTVLFMRLTVIFSDLILLVGVMLLVKAMNQLTTSIDMNKKNKFKNNSVSVILLIIFNGGLLLIDHIHFQYNGLLLGLLLISISSLMISNNYSFLIQQQQEKEQHKQLKGKEEEFLIHQDFVWGIFGGISFAMLIVMKHLYLPLASVFFLHILFSFCYHPKKGFLLSRFVAMGVAVLVVMIFPFLPLIYDHYKLLLETSPSSLNSELNPTSVRVGDADILKKAFNDQIFQIVKRLFPFVNSSDENTNLQFLNYIQQHYPRQECSKNVPGDSTCTIDNDGDYISSISNADHERGLLHSYWAPNFWAVYAFMDRILTLMVKFFANHFSSSSSTSTSFIVLRTLKSFLPPMVEAQIIKFATEISSIQAPTNGLVDQIQFAVLPNITPLTSLVLTIISIAPSLFATYTSSSLSSLSLSLTEKDNGMLNKNRFFLKSIVHIALSGFVFGWHVHEKGILTALIPLSVLAVQSEEGASLFYRLSAFGIYALLPLFTHVRELPTKALILVAYLRLIWTLLFSSSSSSSSSSSTSSSTSSHYVDKVIIVILVCLFIVCEVVLPYLISHKLIVFEFLPLMMTSVICGIGIVGCWGSFTTQIIQRN